jgi:hypothetical protein
MSPPQTRLESNRRSCLTVGARHREREKDRGCLNETFTGFGRGGVAHGSGHGDGANRAPEFEAGEFQANGRKTVAEKAVRGKTVPWKAVGGKTVPWKAVGG